MINYSKVLKKIVGKGISRGEGYMDLLKTTLGADPREIWEIFKEYKQEPRNKIGITNFYPEFPEPHMAYAQWRMTPESSQRVLENLVRKNYQELCFLGCPVLGTGYDGHGKIILLDVDETILSNVQPFGRRYDVGNNLPEDLSGKFDCVVTDPPWYPEEIKLFLMRSMKLVRKGGTIYFSLPQLLTRPSVFRERFDLERWLDKNKIIIVAIMPSVEYEVPPFEYMAYEDIPSFTGEVWRRGNWVELKKQGEVYYKPKKIKPVKWQEFGFGEKRVLLRDKETEGKSKVSQLGSLILNSVSRRNPLIPFIDIWSSRNAVLSVDSGFSGVRGMLKVMEEEYAETGKVTGRGQAAKKLVELILA